MTDHELLPAPPAPAPRLAAPQRTPLLLHIHLEVLPLDPAKERAPAPPKP